MRVRAAFAGGGIIRRYAPLEPPTRFEKRAPPKARPLTPPARARQAHWLLLGLILLVGVGLRFYRLGEMPPGLYQDEAYNGLDALDVLDGAHPIFFTANNGREPFYIYLVAASVAALGRSPLAVRLPAALIGSLTILAAYALGRALYTPRLGLLAAAVTALTFWPVALSRIGLRAGSLPLFLALSLACAAAGWRRGPRGMGLLALAGALYGLTFYTYLAARFVPLALIAFLVFWYSAQRRTFPTARQLAYFLVPAMLVGLPLLLAGLRQPEILLGRAGQVSVLNPDINHGDLPGTLLRNLAAALGMFVWRGDDIARHNLPGRPVFDVLLGAAFVAGVFRLGRAALNQRHLPSALLLAWIGTLLAPTLLAEDTPHFLRAAGILPAIFLVSASGLDWLWGTRRLVLRARYAPLRQALVVAALLISGAWTARDYFGRYAAQPATGYLFQSAATELARAINAQATAEGVVWVDRRFWDNFPSVRFLVGEAPGPRWFATGAPVPPLPGAAQTVVFVWPYEPFAPALAALPVGQVIQAEAGPLYRGDLEPAPYPLYTRYNARPVADVLGKLPAPAARFEGGLTLLAYSQQATPEGGRVDLVWQAQPAPGRDYQVFAQALAGDTIVAQADGPLGSVLYPSGLWRPGEVVAETRLFSVPAGTTWAGLTIRIGIYGLATGARLPRVDQPGDALEFTATDRR